MSELRLLWLSTPPNMKIGYSIVTYNVLSRLAEAGFDVVCFGLMTKGLSHIMSYAGKSFRMVGFEDLDASSDADFEQSLDAQLRKHFKNTGRTALITLRDIWALPDRHNMPGFNHQFADQYMTWMPYIPLDAEPVTSRTYFVARNAFKRITMSTFAKKEFAKVGLGSDLVYHGVDTKVFRPLTKEQKMSVRFQMGMPINAFIVGHIGRNLGDRKAHPRMIRIFDTFRRRNNLNDVFLYLHTEKVQKRKGMGYNIDDLIDLYEADNVIMPTNLQVDDSTLAAIINTFDVYLSLSRGEGFGLPIIEAQACGVPCIVARNSAQTELVEGHGWTVKCVDHDVRLTSPLHNKWWESDEEEAIKVLEDTYMNRDKIKEYSEESVEFAQAFDWDKVVENQWIPFLEQAEKDIFSNAMLRNYIKGIKKWQL